MKGSSFGRRIQTRQCGRTAIAPRPCINRVVRPVVALRQGFPPPRAAAVEAPVLNKQIEANSPVLIEERPSVTVRQAEPVLLTKLVKLHASRVNSLLVIKDSPSVKTVVSSGLDKNLATTRLTLEPRLPEALSSTDGSSDGPTFNRHLHVTRLSAPGGPVFSITKQSNPPEGSAFDPKADVLYVGNAAKEVVAWEVRPCMPSPEEDSPAHFQTVATDYTGWVRSLAMMGKWLFSCGCNYLVQHDTSTPIPTEVSKQVLFKGDIQSIVTSSTHVYAASSDGVLRAWEVSKQGNMTLVGEVLDAHDHRISGLALHGNTLYSVSYDGWLKAWNADKLGLVAAIPDAHDGSKIHAAVIGPDGLLYTGGDDQLVRRWKPLNPALDFLAALEPVGEDGRKGGVSYSLAALPPAGQPLMGHSAGVRVLAAGSGECLVSGDAEGDMCIWALPPRATS